MSSSTPGRASTQTSNAAISKTTAYWKVTSSHTPGITRSEETGMDIALDGCPERCKKFRDWFGDAPL